MAINNLQAGKLPPQFMLHQRYLIIKKVNRWSMETRWGIGTVYQAIDTLMAGQQVAIKEMSQSALTEDQVAETIAIFHQEAIILGSLSHPNLPRVREVFSEYDRVYLVMDYVEGKTLHELLEEGRGQPLPVNQVLHYALQLCDVLAYLHQQVSPIIFRDVKPTNIMITQSGQVFLINFNVARFFKDGQQRDTVFLGSRGYAPPEQHGLFQTNPRTDIYGLGATLHFCLTGQNPYYAMDPFTFSAIELSNPQVPLDLALLVHRMLSLDEQLRPKKMLEVRQALMTISSNAPRSANQGSGATLPSSYPNGNRVAVPPAMVAGNIVNRGNSPKPSYLNVNRVDAYPSMIAGNASSRDAAPSTTRSDQPKSPNFSIVFGTFLLLAFSTCLTALPNFFSVPYEWVSMVEIGLALLLWVTTGIAYWLVDGCMSRIILAATNISALIMGAAIITLNSHYVQTTLANLLPADFPYQDMSHQLLTISLVAASVISLGWLLQTPTKLGKFALFVSFGGAIACTILQATQLDTDATKPVLLLIVLMALLEGTLVATRIESSIKSMSRLLKAQQQSPRFQDNTGMLQTIPLQTLIKERANKGLKLVFMNILFLVIGLIFMGVIVAIGILSSYTLFKVVSFVALLIAFSHILSMLVRRIYSTKDDMYISASQVLQAVRPGSKKDSGNDLKHLKLIKQSTTFYLQALRSQKLKRGS
jgi:serine/threonine protein kinase